MGLIICGASEVMAIIARQPVSAVLSIDIPERQEDLPSCVPALREHGHGGIPHLVLSFWDTETIRHRYAPDREQVQKGMDFVLRHMDTGDVIIHCLSGVARSTGMALGILAVRHPEHDELDLIDDLLALRPGASPNMLVVRHADDIAGREGRLVRIVMTHPAIRAHRAVADRLRTKWRSDHPGLATRIPPVTE